MNSGERPASGDLYVSMALPAGVCGALDCPFSALLRLDAVLAEGSCPGLARPMFRCQIHWRAVVETFDCAGFVITYTPGAVEVIDAAN